MARASVVAWSLAAAAVTVTHQEVLFNSYGRVRDVVTGPDGLLYVVLQLPGSRVWDSTPGVVVRLVPLP